MVYDLENRWGINLGYLGVYPRELDGAIGILFSPLLHGDIWHLLSNTFPLIILGTALYYFYEKIANRVVIAVYFLSGLLLWIGFSPFPYNDFMVRSSYHIGASGLVYGIASFLAFSGVFRKNKESLGIALAVVFLYGSLLYGIFPQENGISYEAHFFGALIGFVMAYVYKDKPIWVKQDLDDRTPDFRQAHSKFTYKPSQLQQNANTVIMIRPLNFGYNEETAGSNSFQNSSFLISNGDIKKKGVEEFDAFVQKLKNAGVNVLVFEDQHNQKLPDAVFPNNWISMHEDGKVILYPMLAENRRKERREDIVDILSHKFKYHISDKLDFSGYEEKGKYLEGTGSVVFDHIHRIAYANLSSRTDEEVLLDFCKRIEYKAIVFDAQTSTGGDIYHANVMLSIGENFAVVCSDVIKNPEDRMKVMSSLRSAKQHVIEITEQQMNQFCGNILQLKSVNGTKIIAMSDTAYENYTEEQKAVLRQNGDIVHSNLSTIENYGGGSARCMLAEVFLPR